MKIVMCQPEISRFEWELKVVLANLQKNGFTDVVLLFLQQDHSVSIRLKEEFPSINIFRFKDNREYTQYIPNVKPYLWYRFLDENPEFEKENFLYIDSDVIFREMIDYEKFLDDNIWYGSNCNGYLNADYIKNTKNGEKVLKDMCNIVGVSVKEIENINNHCIGAQLIVKKPQAEYWRKVYEDSNKIWKYFEKLDSNIQKWTAEMWAQLFNMPLFNIIPKIDKEFEFTWATDPAEMWHKNKIYHNAGVIGDENNLFFKGKYVYISPFNDDLSFVTKEKASYFYVKAINEAKK